MGFFKSILGPASKYNKSIPYTYEARVDELRGYADEPLYSYYYADTICGLLEYLKKNNIDPSEAELFEVYQKGNEKIKNKFCVSEDGKWLTRPLICKSMQEHYTGHSDENHCSYRDRDRQGSGPY